MASTNDLSAQAHLAAEMQKLEALRHQFLRYLERKEREVFDRTVAGQEPQTPAQPLPDLSEWLG